MSGDAELYRASLRDAICGLYREQSYDGERESGSMRMVRGFKSGRCRHEH